MIDLSANSLSYCSHILSFWIKSYPFSYNYNNNIVYVFQRSNADPVRALFTASFDGSKLAVAQAEKLL